MRRIPREQIRERLELQNPWWGSPHQVPELYPGGTLGPYLEAAFLLRVVHRVDKGGKRFQRANFFKVYLTNPSLRTALFSRLGTGDSMLGSAVETTIFAQWFHAEEDLQYARWKKGEVDIVHLGVDPRSRWAVEAKWSDRYGKHSSPPKAAMEFCVENGVRNLLITTKSLYSRREQMGVTVDCVPAALYAFSVGFNLIQQKTESDSPVVL